MIKKTSPEQYEILANLEKKCFPSESWNLDQIISHHHTQNSILYFEDENLYLSNGYLMYLENSFEIEILRIGVLPDFRKIGIGEKLINFIEFSIANGRDILLEVNSGNFAAMELYKKKGFINFAIRKRYYPDGNDAILMKKETKND